MNELDRLRTVYDERDRRYRNTNKYSLFNPAYLFTQQQLNRGVLSLLRHHGLEKLNDKVILDLGCGDGRYLIDFLEWGAVPDRLHGVDLLPKSLAAAHSRLGDSPLICADGQYLPYKPHTFDLVIQYTVFTSILNPGVKSNLSKEMLRIVKPNGVIIWYDFWINPTNPDTRGIRPAEIRSLFPNCRYNFKRITLAPPISRRVVPHSWILALLLEKIALFNSHFLAAILPNSNS
jgi:ubiquinone/menaquinone biosynthesis C-methylase UbiE